MGFRVFESETSATCKSERFLTQAVIRPFPQHATLIVTEDLSQRASPRISISLTKATVELWMRTSYPLVPRARALGPEAVLKDIGDGFHTSRQIIAQSLGRVQAGRLS